MRVGLNNAATSRILVDPAVIGSVSGSRYMARLRVTGADCMGSGHKNNILTMDDSCSFRLMNTRKIRS